MNWIVSDSLLSEEGELARRAVIIQKLTRAMVSPWREQSCDGVYLISPTVKYHRCGSKKGEHGFFITAHINTEVQPILQHVLTNKKALVVINSCALEGKEKDRCLELIKTRNPQSELFFAEQTFEKDGVEINYYDNVGTFGFPTTKSERELFQKRDMGLERAIRTVFEKVVN